MKITNEIINKATETINESFDFAVFGLRVQEEEFSLGEMDHVSHVWDDGDDTGEELNGVCASLIEKAQANRYYGDHIALIGGNEWEYGEDIGEIIIRDPTVVEVYC